MCRFQYQAVPIALLPFLMAATAALAGGFSLQGQSAAELGVAYAGAAAAAEDASTIADNPAGLGRLTQPEFVVSGTIVNTNLPFTNIASRLPTGMPMNGPNDDAGTASLLPTIFISSPVTSDFSLGVGVFPSFGLATEYQPGWVGRYLAQDLDVTSFDIAPTASYRLSPSISIGISPVVRYTKVKDSNAIDFGTIGAGIGIPGAIPGQADGNVTVRGSDWSWGINGGILIEPFQGTRVGLAYFHNASAKVSGEAQFATSAVGNIIAAASGAFINTGASTVIAYPDHLNLGAVQQLSPEFDVRVGLTWTQWSSLNQVRILFANPAQPAAVTPDNWRDTVSVTLGGTYQLNPDLVMRAGVSYDETPIPNASHRTPQLPDASRVGAALGAGYRLTDSVSCDFAYEHLFGGTVKLDAVSGTGAALIGKTQVSANLVALQLRVRF
jgi:long-chain fatty acid transport protein